MNNAKQQKLTTDAIIRLMGGRWYARCLPKAPHIVEQLWEPHEILGVAALL